MPTYPLLDSLARADALLELSRVRMVRLAGVRRSRIPPHDLPGYAHLVVVITEPDGSERFEALCDELHRTFLPERASRPIVGGCPACPLVFAALGALGCDPGAGVQAEIITGRRSS